MLSQNQRRYVGAVSLSLVVFFLFAFAGVASAQVSTGTITGTITDAKGAAMLGVQLVVHSVDTGVDKSATSNDSGVYTVPLVPPGSYDVTATQTGFSTVKRPAITVQVGQTVRVDIEMPVSSQQTLVTVTTEIPVLETEKTEQSQTVSESQVSNLPVSSRRWEQFVLLTPGLTPDGVSGAVSFHGLNSFYNNNSVDGANNSNALNSGARGGTLDGYAYSGDSIREFQVASNNFAAELGQAAGGSVNAVTKSGTAQFHGDLFYNGRSPNFNALDPVNSAAALSAGKTPTQAVHQQHQWGGSFGGPLLKDKLFFFVTDDGYRKVTPISFNTSQVNPPISALICPSEITANQCTAAKAFVGQNLGTFPRNLRQDIELLKLDYQLNQANHINAVTNIRDWKLPVNSSFATATDSGLSSSSQTYIQDRFLIATWNWVVSNDKVNEFRYQWGKDAQYTSPNGHVPNAALSSLFSVGTSGNIPNISTLEHRNQISDNFSFIHGRHTFKTGIDINLIRDQTKNVATVAGAYRYSGAIVVQPFWAATGCPTTGGNAIFCDWLLDLYGKDIGDSRFGKHWVQYAQIKDQRYPGNAFGSNAIFDSGADDFTNNDFAGYFQDTWKFRPNITVNAGLRYDVFLYPPPTNPNTNTSLSTYYTAGVPIDYGAIQPRLGVAWNITKNSVIRFGGGIFAAKTSNSTVNGINRTTGTREQQFTCSNTATDAVCAPVTYPKVLFAQQAGDLLPVFTSPLLTPAEQPLTTTVLNPLGDTCKGNPSCSFRGIVQDAHRPSAYEFQAAYERQLPGNLNVSASYIFTRGVHLPNHYDGNIGPAVLTKTYDVVNLAGVTQLTSTVPFFTQRIDNGVGAINAEFTGVNSRYNAMVLVLRKPMSHGVEMLLNYTLSKATDNGENFNANSGAPTSSGAFLEGQGVLDPYHRQTDQSQSAADNRHRVTSSVIWQPAMFKTLSNKAARLALDGWSVSGTLTFTTSTHYSALVQSTAVECSVPVLTLQKCATTGAGANGGVLALNGGMTGAATQGSGTPQGSRVYWLPRESFKLPSYTDVDLRVAKEFTFHERYSFEIRGEAFNLFNSTLILDQNNNAYTYGEPGSSAACPSTHTNTCMVPLSVFQSTLTTSANLLGARQLQAGVRFSF